MNENKQLNIYCSYYYWPERLPLILVATSDSVFQVDALLSFWTLTNTNRWHPQSSLPPTPPPEPLVCTPIRTLETQVIRALFWGNFPRGYLGGWIFTWLFIYDIYHISSWLVSKCFSSWMAGCTCDQDHQICYSNSYYRKKDSFTYGEYTRVLNQTFYTLPLNDDDII